METTQGSAALCLYLYVTGGTGGSLFLICVDVMLR